MRTVKAWGYACGDFHLASLTLPRDSVKKEQRAFTDDEVHRMIKAAAEPFSTILLITAVLGLRIGEILGLRVSDIDFAKRIVRVRQSVDSASRTIGVVKSKASSAGMPMSTELEKRLRALLSRYNGKSELLFVNRNGRPFCADKLREKRLHPLLDKLSIPRGGFHGMRHGAASAWLADGASPALVQKNCVTAILASRWESMDTF
jgi:integrase